MLVCESGLTCVTCCTLYGAPMTEPTEGSSSSLRPHSRNRRLASTVGTCTPNNRGNTYIFFTHNKSQFCSPRKWHNRNRSVFYTKGVRGTARKLSFKTQKQHKIDKKVHKCMSFWGYLKKSNTDSMIKHPVTSGETTNGNDDEKKKTTVAFWTQ